MIHGGKSRIPRLLGCAAFAVALFAAPSVASAFVVTNTHDAGPGSLRQAITDAENNPGRDTVNIVATGTVTLASTLPTITQDLIVNGPAMSQFVVSGADNLQPLRIQSGNASISSLTVTHGSCTGACGSTGGGGIYNAGGTVTLDRVAVTSSATTGQGGGIYNGGTMTLSGAVVKSNTSSQTGGSDAFPEAGGIFNDGMLTVGQSIVRGNTASATGATNQNGPEGGGIYNNGGATATITASTIDANHATAVAAGGVGTTNATGGGAINDGTMNLVRSTVSNNTASGTDGTNNSGQGGGIYNGFGSTFTADRSTVANNSATGSDLERAGGIYLDGTPSITSSTIAHNAATVGANLDVQAATTLKNTIVSDPGGGGSDCEGSAFVASQGFNLADDASCNLTDPSTDKPSADPMLAPSLAANGGLTKTYALEAGSPAIDQGQSSVGEDRDQRSRQRPYDYPAIANATDGDGTDIGAFEVVVPNTFITGGPGGLTYDPTPTFSFKSSEPGSTFQCKLDAHPFAACTSPRTLARLSDGSHTFAVRARDIFGNPDPSPSSRSFSLKTAEVKVSGSTLLVTAAAEAMDNFKVTRPSSSTLRVSDMPGPWVKGGGSFSFLGSGVHAGPGCTTSGDYIANCSASGITSIKVNSGANSDQVLNRTPLPSTIIGGDGYDTLVGGNRADTIIGGPALDWLEGNNGNDTLIARDHASDHEIDCGGGTADKAELDLAPLDPNTVVSGCETKARHQ